MAPIVEAASEALRPAADAKGIQVEMALDPESCLVSGDPNRLRQVIWNLLMNAIKFTPRGGSVSLRLQCVETGARLTVSDTGEGISAEFLPYVFHRFRQEEGSISRKAGGLGLGLAVVRHLVELHGGNVSAESPGPGQGSTFKVDLPLAPNRREALRNSSRDVSGAARGDDSRDVADLDDSKNAFDRRSSDKKGGALAASKDAETSQVMEASGIAGGESIGGSVPLAGVRVLLVEDDDDSRNLLSLILKRYGAEVISASSSTEALNLFAQSPPDVVISDIGMAEEDGYELIRKIRSLESEGHHQSSLIPTIALTGYATSKDRDRALSAGYQLHLAKPVEPDDLVAAILSLLGQRDS